MKSGKYVKLSTRDNIILSYGSVNAKNLKSVYLRLQCWVQPKDTDEDKNYDRIISLIRREIKLCAYTRINSDFFNENYIVDLDLRSSGILPNKRSFMSCEVTLYTKKQMHIKSEEFYNIMKDFSDCIIESCPTLFREFKIFQRKR